MKKATFFLAATFILASARPVFSQDVPVGFFMPQAELQPRYEKLPPVPTLQPKLPSAREAYERRRAQQMQQMQRTKKSPAAVAARPVVRKVKEYIAVDGRFIPVYDESVVLSEAPANSNIAADNVVSDNGMPPVSESNGEAPRKAVLLTDMPRPQPQPENRALPERTIAVNAPVLPPQVAEANPEQPAYRNRYREYLDDLQVFHQTGQMPDNAALDKALSKLSAGGERVLFDGTVK